MHSVKDPDVKAPLPTETQIVTAFMEGVRAHEHLHPELVWLYHLPNEGRRNQAHGWKMGIKSGMPDHHLPIARGDKHGLWIEFKAPGKKPTAEQAEVISFLRSQDHSVHVCSDPAVALNLVLLYLRTA